MADRLVELQEEIQKAGTAGDVRTHRRRAGARPVASDPEHRQQLQADSEDVRGRRVPRDVQADGRARTGHHQARARRPAQHRAADSARAVPGRFQSHGRRRGRSDGTARRNRRPHAAYRIVARDRLYRRGCLRARPRVSQPDPECDPGDRAGRLDRGRQRGARRSRAGAHLRHRLRHSAGDGSDRSSKTSSRPSVAASVSAWRSRKRSSSSSAERFRSPARSERARRSCSSFRERQPGRCSSPAKDRVYRVLRVLRVRSQVLQGSFSGSEVLPGSTVFAQ